MPFFNIPLILKLLRRKSSEDLSLVWVSGVWFCALLMLPWGFLTGDGAFRIFTVTNFLLFSWVAFLVCRYRMRRRPDAS
jgi:hypothetical protein